MAADDQDANWLKIDQMSVRRPPPAPTISRKPQTGLPRGKDRRQGPVMGAQLNYLMWLHDRGPALAELVEQELELLRQSQKSEQGAGKEPLERIMPSPFTGMVRLRPGDDPLLRLDPNAIKQIDARRPPNFDSKSPAVAVSLEFLGAAQDLPPLGMIPTAQAGDIFFGWINLNKVADLAKHEAVVHVDVLRSWEAAGPSRVGDAAPSSGGPPGNTRLTGRGVRIAVIDRGFDFLHPAFVRKVNGGQEARTQWLLDLVEKRRLTSAEIRDALAWYLGPDDRPKPTAVTTHLQRLMLSPGLAQQTEIEQQHGTAVTGIAAGNGRGRPEIDKPPVCGIAPEADLALIAIGRHDETRFADSSDVIAAFQAAFEDTNAACVALMANSDNLGPHDGSLDGERFLDELLLLPGRAIVLTAGNLNHVSITDPKNKPLHAVAQIKPGNIPPQPIVLKFDEGAFAPDSAEVWFRSPANERAKATISISIFNNPIDPVIVEADSAWWNILRPNQNPNNTAVLAQLQYEDEADAYCLRLVFRPAKRKSIVKSEWHIHVTAEGPVHGWLDRTNERTRHWTGAPAESAADFITLGSPASAIRPLAVGSVASLEGEPSDFSGRGPLRGVGIPRKPDLVAVGENVPAPKGNPEARWKHQNPAPGNDYKTFESGTSFAAPQVAGACALLFERFGSAATWADIRQAILQATTRPVGMPALKPDAAGWDNACGYGLLCVDSLLSPPTPEVDIWLPKTPKDDGTEPFVDWTFWNSPDLVLEDAAEKPLDIAKVATGKAEPKRLRVRVRNRGKQPANDVVLSVWWAPLGAAYPLPHPETGGGAWSAVGFGVDGAANNRRRLAPIASGASAEAVFDWAPPRDAEGGVVPHLMLATASTADDPFDPADTACAQNNVAMLSIAAVPSGGTAEFQILGSEDTDGLILWCDPPKSVPPADPLPVRVDVLPITALPWRNAAMFEKSGNRPLYGSPDMHEDLAAQFSRDLDGPGDITEITDVLNADKLRVQNGNVAIESHARLILPRLRIAPGAPLTIKATALDDTAVAIHMLHLSGGRRVGGGTVQIVPR